MQFPTARELIYSFSEQFSHLRIFFDFNINSKYFSLVCSFVAILLSSLLPKSNFLIFRNLCRWYIQKSWPLNNLLSTNPWFVIQFIDNDTTEIPLSSKKTAHCTVFSTILPLNLFWEKTKTLNSVTLFCYIDSSISLSHNVNT